MAKGKAKKKKAKNTAPAPPGGLDALLKEINSAYGVNTISRASEAVALECVRRLPTGIPDLDAIWGGGFPLSRMISLVGEFSSGKSLIAYKTAAAFQRHCRNCTKAMVQWDELSMTGTPIKCCAKPEPMRVVWADVERSYVNTWARRMGCNPDGIYCIRTEHAQQAIDVADRIIRTGACDLLVVDSVAALTPLEEIEASSEEWQMGIHARLMSKAMRKWTSAQTGAGNLGSMFDCSIILINQKRMKIGVVYGNPSTEPGGKAIDFYASIKTEVKKKGVVQTPEGLPVGHAMELACTKNKTAPPGRSAEIKLSFVDYGGRARGATNYEQQVLTQAVFWGVARLEGSWYYLAKGVKVQGMEQAGALLRKPESRKLLSMLNQEVQKKERAWLDGTLE